MNLGTLLEIIVALIFIYLTSSLIISELQEQLAALLEFRARNLKKALEIFLGKETVKSLYNNGSLLSSLNQYTNLGKSAGPSYVEPKVLAESLISLVNSQLLDNEKLLKADFLGNNLVEEKTGIFKKLASISNFSKIDKLAIDRLIEIGYSTQLKHDNPTLEKFVDEIANTFTQIMERTSGVYKRNAKGVSFAFGFLAAALLNIDSFYVIEQLSKNSNLRQGINQVATEVFQTNVSCFKDAQGEPTKEAKCTEKLQVSIKDLETISQPLPLGWDEKGWFNGEQIKKQNGWLQAIFGWLMTGVAVAMGAPFWFDILGKLINVRNAGKPISSNLQK
ncbi:MAG: hypothetical protein EWV75_13995 [Microcystis wesenbergii Mw_QC_S_20081001_S30D]|jgi:hypothetical protein|uniref:Uncharacterized protein n=1 Tax=Microcystis wesenbergii Mw_QC_S_20081001_S30D TaxID=2486245 RepID=A0A552JI14_9CHRO|nr:hypothetical protein [Microcystis aeruginosa W11-03]NCR95308.1 hypothetical protein [Microcystis aeruginosa W11-06]TRU95371.1 MAG: hypothetical protein EWV75_13995 [Microcystis wesenbergii Mw_QC_S_20081001_S30D]TRV00749.1 MAG: hypothetical protein EWV73_10595 [Microcystis wesenbergii Mw_QC_B_20070930_S4D]TRV05991.1 MAG: hypothetical protein EWV74_01800 [Microcystis wesenbergii Mw_QC_S_20081001_S30]TRV17727.1 MAG: hypothetical protein EWV89_01715 [Microcystis wesenbergii Mw_QC_B_20070930_S4]